MTTIFSQEAIKLLTDFTQPIIDELQTLRAKYDDVNNRYREAIKAHDEAMKIMDVDTVMDAKQKITAYGEMANVTHQRYQERRKELGDLRNAHHFYGLLKEGVNQELKAIEQPLWDEIATAEARIKEIKAEIISKRREANAEIQVIKNELREVIGGDTGVASSFAVNTQTFNEYI